jgi:hypothetical protein
LPELEPQTPPPKRPHWTAGSVAIFIIGLLILIPSGLCTGLFGIGALVQRDPEFLYMALTFGGLPTLAGVGLVVLALKMRRRD